MHEDATVFCKFATQLNSCIFQVGVGHGHIHEPCTPAYGDVLWSERQDFPRVLPDFSRKKFGEFEGQILLAHGWRSRGPAHRRAPHPSQVGFGRMGPQMWAVIERARRLRARAAQYRHIVEPLGPLGVWVQAAVPCHGTSLLLGPQHPCSPGPAPAPPCDACSSACTPCSRALSESRRLPVTPWLPAGRNETALHRPGCDSIDLATAETVSFAKEKAIASS